MTLGLVALVLVLVPGVLAWWTGRRVVPLRDDPLLPERLLERTRRLGQASAVVGVLLVVLLPTDAAWALPLAALGLAVGAFPARRALREETWGLGHYLVALGRFQLAMLGFWALLAASPALVLAAGPAQWPMAAALGALLLAWSAAFPRVFIRLVGATRLTRPDLAPRFAGIVARAGIAPPPVYRFGFPGGRLANAFALPARRRAAVLFGDQVLEDLAADEVTAVFAHEVAHLEHYTPARLRRGALVLTALIALAVVGVPLLAQEVPWSASLLGWGWFVAVVVALAARTAHHQRHEAESDRRAAALCGDPEALARGLTKLTTLARLPRRWAVEFERHASHPSLARRVQAIRTGAGTAPGQLPAPALIGSERPGLVVLLEADRITWLEGVPEGTPPVPAAVRERAARVRSMRYSELVELRVRAGLTGGAALVARSRSGRSWSVPIRAADVPAAQAALDVVDAQLGPYGPARVVLPLIARALAGIVVTVGALSTAMAATVAAAVVALVTPGRAGLVTLGATALGAGLLGIWSPESFAGDPTLWASIVLVALALPVFGLARAAGPEPRERERRAALAAAGVLGALGLAAGAGAFLVGGLGPTDLAELPRLVPNACVGLLAAGAALLMLRRRALRWLGAGMAVLAVAPVALAVVGRVGGFGPVLALHEGAATLLRRAEVAAIAGTLRVAPSATRFAVMLFTPGRQAVPPAFRVSDFTGAQVLVAALDVAFLEDGRFLALVRQGLALEVHLLTLDAAAPVWRATVPDLDAPHLNVLGGDAWQVIGTQPDSELIVAATGRVASETVAVKRWRSDRDAETDRAFVAADVVYRVTIRPAPWAVSRWGAVWMLLGPVSEPTHTSLTRLDPDGWRTIGNWRRPVRCEPVAGGRIVCLAPLMAATRVSVVEPRGAEAMLLGEIPGPVWRWSAGATGEIGMITSDGRGALLDVAGRRITQFTLPADGLSAVEALPLPGRFAVLARSRAGSTVSVYEVRGVAGSSGTGLRPSESSAASQPR